MAGRLQTAVWGGMTFHKSSVAEACPGTFCGEGLDRREEECSKGDLHGEKVFEEKETPYRSKGREIK